MGNSTRRFPWKASQSRLDWLCRTATTQTLVNQGSITLSVSLIGRSAINRNRPFNIFCLNSQLVPMATRNYTKIGKWYGITSLILITFFYNPILIAGRSTLLSLVLTIFQGDPDRTLVGMLVLTCLSILWVTFIIIGIFKDKLWAKWLAIVTYVLPALIGFDGFIRLKNTPTDTTDWILTTALLLKIYLPMLVIPILGIVLILKKPTVEEISR
jgi:hypothetical protein